MPRLERQCSFPADNFNRRRFLKVGALAVGGLNLGDILRLRAASTGGKRQKSVIMIFLSGGPSHLDMYDMKPGAPREYRGEFSPIRTNVPGMEICELMPQQAKIADKFAILRGVHFVHLHTANEFYSGYGWQESPRASVPGEAQRPALGSIVSRVRRGDSSVPPYVSLDNPHDWERAYYAGMEHEPFRVGGGNSREALDDMRRPATVSRERLGLRADLLHSLRTIRRNFDNQGAALGVDSFQNRALEIVSSGKVRTAFDLEREARSMRARYGDRHFTYGPHPGRSLLLARRLIEAGVSVVTVCLSGWDTHRANFSTLRDLVPPLDQAVHALVTDLEERGLLDDVAILMGGEFGRTPRIGDITPDGRSHWPDAGFLWMAGGGLRTGQIIGATDARGEKVIGRPIGLQNVLSTLYHVLGIDPSLTLIDHNGRPQYVLEHREPIVELL
jgi:hypothetical protein